MAKKGFIIFRMNIGGHISDRYYKSADNALNAMETDIARLLDDGGHITSAVDEVIKKEKKRVYAKNGVTKDGEMFVAELRAGQFED